MLMIPQTTRKELDVFKLKFNADFSVFKDILKLKNFRRHTVLNLELNGIFRENLPCTCRVTLNNSVKTTCNSSKKGPQVKI